MALHGHRPPRHRQHHPPAVAPAPEGRLGDDKWHERRSSACCRERAKFGDLLAASGTERCPRTNPTGGPRCPPTPGFVTRPKRRSVRVAVALLAVVLRRGSVPALRGVGARTG